MRDARRPAADHAPLGRQIAIASGKGGVGKTFLALQLAHAFARRGDRALVFDGDFGLANLDVRLGLSPRGDLADVVAGRMPLDDAVHPIARGSGAGGIDVLPGRSASGALADLGGSDLAGVVAGLTALAMTYDWVILDLASGVDISTLRMAAAADDVLVVVQDDPAALADALAFMKRLRVRAPHARPATLVNAVDTYAAAGRAHDALARACAAELGYALPFAGAIRRDDAVRDATARRELLAARRPNAAAARDVAALADNFSPHVMAA